MDFLARMRMLAATELVCTGLRLEPITPAHAEAMFAGLSNPALYTFIPQEPPVGLDWLRARFKRISARGPDDGSVAWLNWALRKDARYCGLFEATAMRDGCVDIAYFVFAEDQRQGVAREAATAVIAALWADQDTQVIGASLDTRNSASAALLEALGFSCVGLKKDADFFAGAPSDEFRYERRR